MKKQEQEQYLKDYKKAKEKGIPFFPDVIFKDTIAAFVIFLVLIALAVFIGAPLEEQANPQDTSYTPKPEWYFLFLFQALKYFPGNLEVIGAVIIPTLVVVALFLLPFLDRSPKRHLMSRPIATIVTILSVVLIVGLTVVAQLEAPPPAEAHVTDLAATLYEQNCSSCHGQVVEAGTANLHDVIVSGGHEGMPAWGGDLSADEVDLLVGYISSPQGNIVYIRECAGCHENEIPIVEKPMELIAILDQGPDHPLHADTKKIPYWTEELSGGERNALLNFLAAPDGQRLYTINCAGCHGMGIDHVAETEDLEAELLAVIIQGEHNRDMPAFDDTLSEVEIGILTDYVMDPAKSPAGASLFQANCSSCHHDRVPTSDKKSEAKKAISAGGMHEVMPAWGDVLTPEQLDALVGYVAELVEGVGAGKGGALYRDNCALCHGAFGEGGPNPGQPGDVIAPISTSEYLSTRNDLTLKQIISMGQPNFGMSPFGSAHGGPLENEDIDAIVALMRAWEANPPVDLPPEIDAGIVAYGGEEVFLNICANCHGPEGKGDIGPALNSDDFRSAYDDDDTFAVVADGHTGTVMIGWGNILTEEQIWDVIDYMSIWGGPQPGEEILFAEHIQPLFDRKCFRCHGDKLDSGDWRSDTYEAIMESGKNAPNIIPGDPDSSLLIQRLLNQPSGGGQMPPARMMNERQIQWVIDWVAEGAPNN